ncbi:minor capsid protein [Levilactobacillus wangkuiensis]|uniref:minor capsid protein n=1 Tax=Levilactobacillus wangkuiensis TaxID=2799566 RepID=UPI001941C33A|nr:minor capsid protein [Levilactobacillus wangkuiensis]
MTKKLSYWERRHLQAKAKEIKSTEAYEKALQPELNGLYRDLHAEMEKWYVKYANNQGIDKDEARKAMADINTKHWQLTLKQFEERAKSGGYQDQLDAEYFRSRVARLQNLEQQLQQHTQSFTSQRTETMRNGLAKQYEDTYMRTNYNIQASKGAFTANFAHFNEAQLKMAVSNPWGKDGKDFSKRIWKNYQKELPSYLMDAVLRGTVLGWSPAKVSQMFHARFQDIKRSNIHNLVVSEMGHVAEEATAQGYEENDIEQYEYMATLESHTCDTCGRLDGQIFRLDKRVVGVNYPLIHARCRCTTVPYIEDLPDVTERWSRDPDTGKGKMVKDIKFNQWKKLVGEGKPVPVYKSMPKIIGINPLDKGQWPKGIEVADLPDGEMINFKAPTSQQVNREWLQKLLRYEDNDELVDNINYYLGRFATEVEVKDVAAWIAEVKKFKTHANVKKKTVKSVPAVKAKSNNALTGKTATTSKSPSTGVASIDEVMNAKNKAQLDKLLPSGSSLFDSRLSRAPENMQQLFMKYNDHIALMATDSGDSFYSPFTKTVHVSKKTIGNKNELARNDIDVVFHEMAHAMDNTDEIGTYVGTRYLRRSQKKFELRQVLSGSQSSKYRLYDSIHEEGMGVAREIMNGYYSPDEASRAWREKNIGKDESKWREYADVSDMIDAATSGEMSLGFGHDKKYWTSKISRATQAHNGTAEKEFFAECTSATINNPGSLSRIKKWFPKSYKIYEQIVEDMIQGG